MKYIYTTIRVTDNTDSIEDLNGYYNNGWEFVNAVAIADSYKNESMSTALFTLRKPE